MGRLLENQTLYHYTFSRSNGRRLLLFYLQVFQAKWLEYGNCLYIQLYRILHRLVDGNRTWLGRNFMGLNMKAITILVVFFLFISCKENSEEILKKTFDAAFWSVRDDEGNYAHRDEMLEDLVYKVQLKGLTKEKVITMLGEPDRTNNDYLYYDVYIKEENRVFPFQKRYLVLKLAKDNTVEWRKIKD